MVQGGCDPSVGIRSTHYGLEHKGVCVIEVAKKRTFRQISRTVDYPFH